MIAINIENLTYSYDKNTPILSDLNLSVQKGAIYGFLGANGTGKSTTIRNIVGLLKPNAGKIKILDEDINNNLNINRNIGALIEAPSLYGHLSAEDHLKIICKYQGYTKSRIEEVLEQVGLQDAKKKKTKAFSLGMKQRLGLGMALVHDPEILILDEPTIGLDPNGIKDMRQYIQELSDQGKTILLSSHHLEEVEKIASHIGILQNGKLTFEGTISDLDSLRNKDQKIVIHCNDSLRALNILQDYTPEKEGEGRLQLVLNSEKDIPSIVKTLVLADIDIYELTKQQNNLENTFFELTENK